MGSWRPKSAPRPLGEISPLIVAVMDTMESNLVWKHRGLKDALVNALREFEASPTKCSCRTSEIRSESLNLMASCPQWQRATRIANVVPSVLAVGTLGICLFLIILG